MRPESFDAVLAEVARRYECTPIARELHGLVDRLAAAHARELAEQQATIEALRLDNSNLRKGWQHQLNAVNSWADRCIEQEDRAVAAEARADAAMGLLREAACPMVQHGCDGEQYPEHDSHGLPVGVQCQWCYERKAALAEQALAGGERKDG